MSGEDELAKLIEDTCWPAWRFPATPRSLADAIIDSGWHRTCPVPALSFTEQEADRNARGDVAWAELNTDPYEHPGYCDDPDCAECPRPCCHTTGPNHHPACTTNRTEQQ